MSLPNITFEEALEFLINKGVTAYELHKFSGQSEAGLRKILKGTVDKPRRKTKEIIINFYKKIKDEDSSIERKDIINKENLLNKTIPLSKEKIQIVEDVILFSREELIENSEIIRDWIESFVIAARNETKRELKEQGRLK